MDSISGRCFLSLLQETSEYKMDEMNYKKVSYWKDMERNYSIEEYVYQNVHDLADKIAKVTGMSLDASKHIAVEAYRIFFNEDNLNEKEEKRNIGLPDFVYNL